MTIDLSLFAALSQREWFLLGICAVIYATLFVVALQNSRRKMLILRQRLERVQQLQQEKSQANIQQNQQRLVELQGLIQKLGDENSMLRLELEEKEARLTYNNKVAALENERRSKAESLLFASPVYLRLQDAIQHDDSMTATDIADLARVIDELYDGFTAALLGLCKMNSHDATYASSSRHASRRRTSPRSPRTARRASPPRAAASIRRCLRRRGRRRTGTTSCSRYKIIIDNR